MTPSIMANRSYLEEVLCCFLVKIVTCGVSIEEGVDDMSLHVIEENETHRFPDVLKRNWCIRIMQLISNLNLCLELVNVYIYVTSLCT